MFVSKTSFFFFSRMTMSVEKKQQQKFTQKKSFSNMSQTQTPDKRIKKRKEKKFSRKKKKSKNFESIPTKFG